MSRFKKRAELDETELEHRDQLVDMCVSLARAILQNSYYTDDHPQLRKLGQAPFAAWQVLGKRLEELSFVVASWSEEEIMAVEGVFTEAIGLDTLVGGTAGEHFARKLFTFAKRNKLVSFALKNTIGEAEFHRFIRVFVKRHVDMEAQHLLDAYEDDDDSGSKFTDQLLDADVVNVSVVLEQDLVADKRRLPWRVKIALARLRKDLKTIPMYSQATASQLKSAKLRLLRDILRPLRRGAYLKQLFLNLDLIQQEVEELQDVELESDLMFALPDTRIRALTSALLREHEKLSHADLKRSDVREGLEETLYRQLRLVGARLSERPDAEAIDLLRELYEKKAVPLDALPKSLRGHIRNDRWTANYLKDPDAFLMGFDLIESAAAYVSQVPNLVGIVPNLCRVRRFQDAARVVALLERHRSEPGPFAGREKLVSDAMRRLEGGPTLQILMDSMVRESPEVRTIIRGLFRVMGRRAVKPLVHVLETSDRGDVRSDCALTLVSLDEDGRATIENRLLSRAVGDRAAVYLLKALAGLGHADSTDVFVMYSLHRNAAVREEALRALTRLHGRAANHVVARATTDSNPAVAQRAIRLLADQGSRHPAYLYVLLQILDLAPMSQSERRPIPIELKITAVNALARLPNARLGLLGPVEDILLRCLDRDESTVMSILQRGKTEDTDQVRIAVCQVLAERGGEKSLQRLRRHAIEPSPVVRPRMAQAAVALERRLASVGA